MLNEDVTAAVKQTTFGSYPSCDLLILPKLLRVNYGGFVI